MRVESAISGEVSARVSSMPLFHAAWLFALGIALTRWIWLRPSAMLLCIAALGIVCGVAAVRAQRLLWLPLACLWCALGAWCALMEPQPAPEAKLASLSDGLLRTVEGTVVDAGPVRGEVEQNLNEDGANDEAQNTPQPSQRIDLRVADVELVTDVQDAQIPVSGSVRLTVRWPESSSDAGDKALRCGERVRAIVRLLPPAVYHDPGVWSREEYLLAQGITSTGSVSVDRVERIGTANGSGSLACRTGGWQREVTTRLLALPASMRGLPAPLRLNGEDAVMLAAMIAGDRTYLTHSLRVGFERTGSFHMLVVSGFHLAIVAGCIFWITRRLRVPRVWATLITIAVSFAYALFTGFATPVQRSLWMVALYLVGRLFYRERSAMNVIGFASLCLLAARPRSLFESSLQMTLLAVVAIAGVAAPILQGTVHPYLTAMRDLRLVAIDVKLSPRIAQFRVLMRMIAARIQETGHGRIAWSVFPWTVRFCLRLIELVVVSCVVELAMTLPMAVYFHRITIFALPVNLLILPLLAILMPAALVMLVALVAWPAAAVAPATLVAIVLHVGVGLVHLFGGLAFGDFRVPMPLASQRLAFWLLLAGAILLAHLNILHMSVTSGRWLRRCSWAALALGAAAAVAPRPVDHPSDAMLVEAIDVGQGDSLLIVTPDGKTLLVDGGGFGGGPHQAPQDYDIGEEVVSAALWSRGIRHLDAVALSHAHSDHMGGLPTVLRNFHPDELWVGKNPRFDAYDALINEAATLHVRVRSFTAGEAFGFGATRVDVLAPFNTYAPGPEPSNNDSMVLHIAYGEDSVLLEGDAEQPVEQAMLSEAGLKSTLLKVGHHGSVTSSTPEFLAHVTPQAAVISSGVRNRYGHPRQEVLDELQAARVRTFRTDTEGMQCFDLDGKGVRMEESCGDGER